MRRGRVATIVACALAMACAEGRSQTLTVFRCVAADGAVALQDRPCPPRQDEEVRTLRRPLDVAPPPAPPPQTAPPAPPAPEQAPPPLAVRPPPPPRYECRAPDGSTYEHDRPQGETRWVPLWVLGMEPRAGPGPYDRARTRARPPGGPSPYAAAPTREAGTWVVDPCRPMSAQEVCSRRAAQAAGLQRRARHLGTTERARLDAERAAIQASMAQDC